jgi:hypothetical protein
MYRVVAAAVTCLALALLPIARSAAADPEAAPPPTKDVRTFEVMRYFILDETRQRSGRVGHAFVVLIGHPNETRFHVSYDGSVTHLAATRRSRQLIVNLKHEGSVVATVLVLDLTTSRGDLKINRRVQAEATVAFDNIDAAEARIRP